MVLGSRGERAVNRKAVESIVVGGEEAVDLEKCALRPSIAHGFVS